MWDGWRDGMRPEEFDMKRALMMLALSLAVSAGVAAAGDETVTLEGKVMCSKFALKDEGVTKCHNVLAVEKEGAEPEFYYFTKNSVNDDFGEVCMATPHVRVTGKVMEKDGKRWVEATSIEHLDGEKIKHG